MLFSTWLRNWKGSLERRWALNQTLRRRPPARRLAPRLRLEALEDRTLLSTFLVTNTLDSGTGSLRQAILNANAANTGTAASPDLIQFNIPTSDPGYNSTTGAFPIKPLSALPTVTDTVVLDGYSQPGTSPNTLAVGDNAVLKIVLDGSLAGAVEGLVIGGGNSTVRGLVVDNFAYGSGIVLSGSGNHLVMGNFIGTDVIGVSAAANNNGIATRSPGNEIGGTSPGARNIISGNNSGLPDSADGGSNPSDHGIDLGSNGNVIQGNYIGTDKSGAVALGNGAGVFDGSSSSNQTVGGLTSTPGTGAGNVISGNAGDGVFLGADNLCLVAGNLIGTTATGLAALGNGGVGGIELWGSYNTIGGTTPGARNVISANSSSILAVGIAIEQVYGTPGNVQYNLVEGNFIGTDITGTVALGGQSGGIVVEGDYNTIGGTTATARNIISGNGGSGGIQIQSRPGFNAAYGNVVEGNYIGTDVSGTHAIGNYYAVWLRGATHDNTVGGTLPGEGNLISGGGGVVLASSGFPGGPTNNLIQGNLIGTDKTGTVALGGPSDGISIEGANNNMIGGTTPGAGNTIAFTSDNTAGVDIESGIGDSILGNSIFMNTPQGIFLNSANNANNNQAAPVLTSVSTSSSGTTISGTLTSVANTTFRIEFFANAAADPSGYGQGKTFLGAVNVTTNSSGAGSFTFTLTTPLPASQTVVSATATKLVGTSLTPNDTSQFSRDVSVPSVGPITAPLAPVAINTTINTSASFTDAIPSNTHTALWNWGDGTTSSGTVSESNGSGTVTGSHAYAVDGVYTITLTVTNNVGGSGQSVFNYVVVYNPSAGFVTGGGWFNSPAGAYAANPALTGKANFGLNAKYHQGDTVPSGNTEFQFPAANLNFHATSYDWLVINGNQAQYQGSGTINGAGNYGFLVTALDNGGGSTADDLRIKIWDKNNNAVVYDTQPGAATTAPPTTPLGGGRIQVHTSGQTASAIGGASGSPSNSTVVTNSAPANPTPAPAAPAAPASSSGAGWSAFGARLLGTLERDLIQWEDAMTKELVSLIQIVDQVFIEWESAVLNPPDPATNR